jgi:glycosyltransferase involved in cell wall biosynthesis
MNICIVANEGLSTTGGLATYARELCKALGVGHEVLYVSRFDRALPGELNWGDSEPQKTHRWNNVNCRVIAPAWGYRPLLRRLIHLMCRPRLRPLARRLYQAAYAAGLDRAVPHDAQVILCIGTGWELLGFAARQLARQRGVPLVVCPAVHPNSWGDGPIDIELYNQADGVIVYSEAEKKHLISRGAGGERTFICRLAPPPVSERGNGAAFRQRHHLGSRPLVLFVGKKSRGKGYHALCQAMGQVLAAVPQACLIAIGPDSEPPFPAAPDGALLDLGFASESEKQDAFAACDVFCMPSDADSFGIVYAEAWTYGKPVVAGPAPAPREFIAHEVNGLHSSQEPGDIAACLVRLLTDPSLAQRLGAAGQDFQQSQLTWQRVRDTHLNIFRAVSNDKRESSAGG